ncbi:Glutathione import ATP-binding protein GsiA [uncultured Clostridium sp.]|uniref:Nickel import system ATP-binding protein NikD n=1 Tax=Muricoprocola aceti TaxID=2981772 RepID=A0ABT2SQT1_9FIRM|nr:ABC transporter ATP-binding protein [Muricoprocola aceti]MCI7226861.1 ABC transporter ATP-binding protein [Lachnospiraceae bacterium]RGD63706.1 ABC transporter ATP-binding protein [Lachnospiraceae bacterium OF09-6]SCH98814.1 Glutathione import ATP-binding protein GsiA [uncultured Clostridium sp.]MCU6726666.1 ABC transporter ATP-binding protein [Muricoprocola aceti]MDD7436630.1 ABC transporter ATP-binding protein [Lachnospiraceae bacterium]
MDNEKKNLLEIRDLTVEYHTNGGVVHAVNGLNLEVAPKETLGFVGETGAGKTTTALSILNLLPHPQGKVISGSIKYNGEEILNKSNKDMTRIRGEKISMIFQDPMTSLNPVMTVGDQIAEGIRLHDHLSKADAHKKALEMLKTVGIRPERASDYPHQFSGGMKQRVVIAIALACNPELLIADEPTTALDVTIQAQMLELMKGLKDQYDTSMIMITHDLGIVAEICDKVAIMYAGNVVEYGDKVDIFTPEKPHHPYTVGLFDSIPDIYHEQEELKIIKGLTPDPTDLPSGCTFHPRCPYACEKCSKQMPKHLEVEPGHTISCHRFDDTKEVK